MTTSVNVSPNIKKIIDMKHNTPLKELYKFLGASSAQTEKGDPETTICDLSYFKSYHFAKPDQVAALFAHIDEVRQTGTVMHFTERQQTASILQTGIMIDFDRKQVSSDREFSAAHFNKLTRTISKAILASFDVTDPFHIIFILRPKPTIVDGSHLYKDGFHILIPELWITKQNKRYLLDSIKPKIAAIFGDIPHDVQTAAEMLDYGSISVPNMLYGSCKTTAQNPYVIGPIQLITIDEIEQDTFQTPITAPPDANLTYELSLSHSLSKINNSWTWLKKRPISLRDELASKVQDLYERRAGTISVEELDAVDNTVNCMLVKDPEYELYAQLLDILSLDYVTDYVKWTRVVWALANTRANYMSLAIKFSQRCPDKWNRNAFDEIWATGIANRGRTGAVTIRSIMHWARECSPERYEAIYYMSYQEEVQAELFRFDGRLEHASVGKLLKIMQGNRFACLHTTSEFDGRNKICWYKYVLPEDVSPSAPWTCYKWKQLDDPFELNEYMYEKIPIAFDSTLDYVKELLAEKEKEEEPSTEAKYWKEFITNIKKTKRSLANDTFQSGCIRQAIGCFKDQGFELDKYPDIIGVRNGLLELGPAINHMKGYNEYRISKALEIRYLPYGSDTANDLIVSRLLRVFHEIFLEDDVFEFMLCHAATGLDLRAPATLLTILVGGGSNGKTFFLEMISNTLGKFSTKLASGLLTDLTSGPEKPNSAKMALKGLRWGYFDEFSSTSTLRSIAVKQITGSSKQSARDLNARQEQFANTANLIAASNYELNYPDRDHGSWRRIYQYRCKTKFGPNPDPSNPFEKLEDSSLSAEAIKDPEYQQATLTILAMYYERLHTKWGGMLANIPVPTIMAETQKYRMSQDTMHRFISTMLEPCPGELIHVVTLVDKYLQWYKLNISRDESKDRRTLIEDFKLSALKDKFRGGEEILEGFIIKEYQ
jgi:hypothetical protein